MSKFLGLASIILGLVIGIYGFGSNSGYIAIGVIMMIVGVIATWKAERK